MFICDDCLEKHYNNGESILKSYGRCEICEKTEICSDISSKFLKRKKTNDRTRNNK